MRPLPPDSLVRLPGLRDRAPDGVVDQLLVPLPPGAAVIDLRDRLAVRVVAVGVDRAERADAAGEAQWPEEMPLEIETPLPPSTSGRTSTPPMRIALIAFMAPVPLAGNSASGDSVSDAAARMRPGARIVGRAPGADSPIAG